jgi:hypothetical protein
MPRPPRRSFKLTGEDIELLKGAVRNRETAGHVCDAAVIMLVSVDTPAYETSAKLLDIDKREVDRVQKAFMAGGVQAVLNLPLSMGDVYQGKRRERKHGHVARMKTILAQPSETAPESIEQLSKQLSICKDYSRKLAKKHGIEMPSPYSDKVLGEKIRALLKTEPKKHAKWTYLEAAETLDIHRGTLMRGIERFGIDFPKRTKAELKSEIKALLKADPTVRPFWTFVELGQLLGIGRFQAQSYCIEFGIELPPHPLEAKIRAVLKTPPPDGGPWTPRELALRVDMNRSWVREFCVKKGIELPSQRNRFAKNLPHKQ